MLLNVNDRLFAETQISVVVDTLIWIFDCAVSFTDNIRIDMLIFLSFVFSGSFAHGAF